MDTVTAIQFMILAILLLLSAFFSSAETALSTVNRVRIRALAEEGDKRALTVQNILDHYSKMLSTVLVGNNIVNISASSLATTIAIRLWGSYAVGFMTGALTLFVLLFGEIVPKNWAMCSSEKISLSYAGIIQFLMIVLTPLIFIVDKLSGFVMALLHIDPSKKADAMTERDLKTYVDVGHEDGAIETEEREMIYNVFDFSDSRAKDVMVPKIDITMVNIDASYNELFAVFKESMYTRIPVYQDDTDNVIGIVHVKDFLFVPNKREFKISDILRKVYYTYEFKKTADLMMEIREAPMNVAIVLNEYGACVGMVSLEDLLEEIVGEIRDEYDEEEKELIQKTGERSYLVEGSMKLDDINDALGTSLDSEDYDSIGGILIETLDRLPEKGETITLEDGTELRAESLNHNRIEKVLLTLPEPEETPEEDDSVNEKENKPKEAEAPATLPDGTETDYWLDPVLYDGRPEDTSGLEDKEVRCYDFLDRNGVSYKRTVHSALPTIAACEEAEKLLGTHICKNLFLSNRQGTDFYLVLMPGEKKFQTKELSSQLGVARLSFADEAKMEEFLDITPGSVSILGLMNDKNKRVRLIIDQDVLSYDNFACHPCLNTTSLKFSTKDLVEKVIPALDHEPTIVEL
ncbi:MAG: CNNM domain-containing protein [Lachnospiraceae bacterium]